MTPCQTYPTATIASHFIVYSTAKEYFWLSSLQGVKYWSVLTERFTYCIDNIKKDDRVNVTPWVSQNKMDGNEMWKMLSFPIYLSFHFVHEIVLYFKQKYRSNWGLSLGKKRKHCETNGISDELMANYKVSRNRINH